MTELRQQFFLSKQEIPDYDRTPAAFFSVKTRIPSLRQNLGGGFFCQKKKSPIMTELRQQFFLSKQKIHH